jgi:CBS domain-containing protein
MSERKVTRVRDVMKSKLDTIDRMETIENALKEMQHIDTKCLIVEKRDENDEYGILLISDIARNVLARDCAPERVNVYEVMTKPVISVNPDMDIRYCARLFDRFDITRAPVLENKKVIGIVSFTDLVLRGLAARY